MPSELDSEARDAIAAFRDRPAWHTLSIEEARRREAEMFGTGTPPPEVDVADRVIEGPGGGVRLRLYRPENIESPPVVFFHGGGFVMGSPETIEDLTTTLCQGAGSIVVSVAYRLAPEHPFPAAIEDGLAAVRWVSETLVDEGALIVGGTSAGAAIATVVCRLLGDEDGPSIARQVLAYPMTDVNDQYPSRDPDRSYPLLSAADVSWFWNEYLQSEADRVDRRAAPLNTDDFEGLSPVTIVTAGVDVLRDEGHAYVDALRAAGVDVTHRRYPGMPHGFLSLAPAVSTASQAIDALINDIRG